MLIYYKLDIVKADNANSKAQLLCILQDDPLHPIGDGERRIDGDGITGVDAGTFHQLHDSRNKDIVTVADRIYLDFFAADVLVYQYRFIGINLHRIFEIMTKLCFICNNLHGPAAQHKARTNKHRIADFCSSPDTFLNISDGLSLWLRDSKLQQNLFKAVTVFRPLNGLTIRANQVDAALFEGLRQIDGGLSAKRGNHALRLFKVDNRHDILWGKRLKIELICGCIIRRHRLRIIVDDNRLIPRAANGLDRMHR